jgi:hypothetical protein
MEELVAIPNSSSSNPLLALVIPYDSNRFKASATDWGFFAAAHYDDVITTCAFVRALRGVGL